MGNLLGFGGVKIKKTDGVSSIALQFSMTNHKKLVDTINSRISEYKINQKENTSVLTAKTTLSEELRELSNLNKDGVISNEQFEILKRKLIR